MLSNFRLTHPLYFQGDQISLTDQLLPRMVNIFFSPVSGWPIGLNVAFANPNDKSKQQQDQKI